MGENPIQFDFFKKKEDIEEEVEKEKEKIAVKEAEKEYFNSETNKEKQEKNKAIKTSQSKIRSILGMPPKVPEKGGQRNLFKDKEEK